MSLFEMEERERYEVDKQKLRDFNLQFHHKRFDNLHLQFLDKHCCALDIEDVDLVRRVFNYIKDNFNNS